MARMMVLLAMVMLAAPVAAEDTVVLRSKASPEARIRVKGQIIDYNGRELSIDITGAGQKTYPAEQVVEVHTQLTPEVEAADALLAQRQFEAAIKKYLEGARTEQRRWVRHQILAQLIQCHRELGASAQAGDYFLGLVRDDPDTPYFDLIPLAWVPGELPPGMEEKAQQWLSREDSPVAMLLGASYLLMSPRGAAAAGQLDKLTTNKDPRIAALAEAQRWRKNFTNASDDQLATWSNQLDRCPAALRAGPYLALGRALTFRGHHDDGAIALMHVPILFPEERTLASEALWMAGQTLEQQGKPAEARRLYHELLTKHPESKNAPLARQQLEAKP